MGLQYGVKPEDYDVTIVEDLATTSVDIEDLTTGKPYYIRLSSISNKGVSLPTNSVPIAIAPGGIPGKGHLRATVERIHTPCQLRGIRRSQRSNG